MFGKKHLTSTTTSASLRTTSAFTITASSSFRNNFFLDLVNNFIRYSQIFDCAATDVAFRHPPEFVTFLFDQEIMDYIPLIYSSSKCNILLKCR